MTPQQDEALNLFLKQYSDELLHIAAWIAQEEDEPVRLPQSFEDHSSPNAQAISDICRKMVSSLLILRNEC